MISDCTVIETSAVECGILSNDRIRNGGIQNTVRSFEYARRIFFPDPAAQETAGIIHGKIFFYDFRRTVADNQDISGEMFALFEDPGDFYNLFFC